MSRFTPGWWRPFLLVILLEPVVLAILYFALGSDSSEREAASRNVIPPGASVAFAREPAPTPMPAPVAGVEATAAARPDRVVHEGGRYVIELQAAELAPTLAMLSSATKARVTGSDIFEGGPLRLTRSAVASSPREAWQAVFGDIANLTIVCSGSACDVRFISLVAPGSAPAVARQERDVADVATASRHGAAAEAPTEDTTSSGN